MESRRSAPSYGLYQVMALPCSPRLLVFPLGGPKGLLNSRQLAGGQLPVTRHHGYAGTQLVGFRHLPARHPHTRRYPILSLAPRLAFPGATGAGYRWPAYPWWPCMSLQAAAFIARVALLSYTGFSFCKKTRAGRVVLWVQGFHLLRGVWSLSRNHEAYAQPLCARLRASTR